MEHALLPIHNHISFEVYFEKLSYHRTAETNKETESGNEVLIKGTLLEKLDDDLVRIRIDDLSQFQWMKSEQNKSTKSGVIELKASNLVMRNEGNDVVDGDATDSDYDSGDPRYYDLEEGAPFVSGEYYFIGIISNKVMCQHLLWYFMDF